MSNSLVTLWTVAHQAPLSMRFPREEYWSGLPFPSPGDLPDPGIEPMPPALKVDSLTLSHLGSPLKCILISKLIMLYILNRYSFLYAKEGKEKEDRKKDKKRKVERKRNP